MFKRLLLLGLVLLPFYEFFIYILIPGAKVPEWIDMRVTKEYIAVGLAIALTVTCFLEGNSISCPNKWAIIFIGFLFFNLSKSPINVSRETIDVARLGQFLAEFKIFSFFLMFCCISSTKLSNRFIKVALKTIYLSAVVMGIYMIMQALRLDQIYKPLPLDVTLAVKSPGVAGFFGQPTLAVPFLCSAIPLALFFKDLWSAGIIAVSSLLTGSDFAILSIVVVSVLYFLKNKWIIIVPFVLLGAGAYSKGLNFFNDNGRLVVWKQILSDVFTGRINGVEAHIGMTGAGINNFSTFFTAIHQSPYTFAHNEYLQILWSCGIIGLGIFLMIHIDVIKTFNAIRKSEFFQPLALFLLVMCLCACGTFVWQLGIYQYFTVAILGIVYQLKRTIYVK